MRITIVESEIKEAIVAFVASQLTIKEGQEITVDFKATRGEDGATAEISVTAPVNKAPAKTVRKVMTTTAVKPEVVEDNKTTNPEKAQEASQDVSESTEVDNPTEEANATVEETQAVEEPYNPPQDDPPAGTSVEEPEEAKAIPQTGSLFSKLQRPKND